MGGRGDLIINGSFLIGAAAGSLATLVFLMWGYLLWVVLMLVTAGVKPAWVAKKERTSLENVSKPLSTGNYAGSARAPDATGSFNMQKGQHDGEYILFVPKMRHGRYIVSRKVLLIYKLVGSELQSID